MSLRVFAVAAAALFATAPVMANDLIDATDPARILNIARGFGSADLEKDSQGDPKITGRIEGTRYTIFFYGCTNNTDCDDIQFYAAWNGNNKFTQAQMNEWNRTKRYGKAYLDRDNDPVLEMVVNIDYGVSRRNIEDSFNWWKVALRGFKKDVLGEN
ncbi:YbjN domain-containing protein [Pseudothauera lacus]|uniref:YbjN domain-containing protein n=1 Tax=Pseudothauera lacus TaxID=2136175 RepID=A0A2T4IBL6_9RHOO|nr:YbjN domain-containing protein [Pseudothauera lacus]PTD95170.1 YbjN domain-containing protein [Pseudothauera lacus]